MAQEQHGERSMQARVGRDKQRYGPNGERLVAGVVALSADGTQVLLIQSSGRTGWVLPKGGWETDEGTREEAARREAWEEAGIECDVAADLGEIEEQGGGGGSGGGAGGGGGTNKKNARLGAARKAPTASYRFYEVRVTAERDSWPEQHKRARAWMPYATARELLKDRPELLEALERSSIRR